jgi:hypothetical protein
MEEVALIRSVGIRRGRRIRFEIGIGIGIGATCACKACKSVLGGICRITYYFGIQWFEADYLVLRVSLASFLFFTIFSVLVIGVKDERDFRDSWHHGGWMAKTMAWFSLLLMSLFFVSNDVIGVYGELCKFGSGFFLLIQVVLLLDFTHTWNEAWASKDHQLFFFCDPFFNYRMARKITKLKERISCLCIFYIYI